MTNPILLSDILTATGGQLAGRAVATSFTDFCFDARRVAPGQIFLALQSDNDDGDQHMSVAIAGGATGILCERPPEDPGQATVIVVSDTREALRAWSAYIRGERGPDLNGRHLANGSVDTRPKRPTWVEVDMAAIAGNVRALRDLVGPRTQVMAVLKADAYGHGALRVARTALDAGATWIGLACLSEAAPLRQAGITEPILVLGYTPTWQAGEALRLDLDATIFDMEGARAFSDAAVALGHTARLHLKVDTGMNRLGVPWDPPQAVADMVAAVQALSNIELRGIFTHFAKADTTDQSMAKTQLARFHSVLDALADRGLHVPIAHAANSAAALSLPEARFDLVRTGIAMYGLQPSAQVALPAGFRPALAFKTQVAQVHHLRAGDGVSYGATFVADRDMTAATLPVGYADGFRRGPRNWGAVLIGGRRAPILGVVCMDQVVVDVSSIPDVRQGHEVVLIGRQGEAVLSAEEVAERLGTINYEVVSAILARVPRVGG